MAAGQSAGAISLTATVDAGATGTLVNYAQVDPAVGETRAESNLLGSANGGYEDGNPATGSNNDDSQAINVVPAAALPAPEAPAAIPTLDGGMLLWLSVLLGGAVWQRRQSVRRPMR